MEAIKEQLILFAKGTTSVSEFKKLTSIFHVVGVTLSIVCIFLRYSRKHCKNNNSNSFVGRNVSI